MAVFTYNFRMATKNVTVYNAVLEFSVPDPLDGDVLQMLEKFNATLRGAHEFCKPSIRLHSCFSRENDISIEDADNTLAQ